MSDTNTPLQIGSVLFIFLVLSLIIAIKEALGLEAAQFVGEMYSLYS